MRRAEEAGDGMVKGEERAGGECGRYLSVVEEEGDGDEGQERERDAREEERGQHAQHVHLGAAGTDKAGLVLGAQWRAWGVVGGG